MEDKIVIVFVCDESELDKITSPIYGHALVAKMPLTDLKDWRRTKDVIRSVARGVRRKFYPEESEDVVNEIESKHRTEKALKFFDAVESGRYFDSSANFL